MQAADLEIILRSTTDDSPTVAAIYTPPGAQTRSTLLDPTPLPHPLDRRALLLANLDPAAYGQHLTTFLFGPPSARTPLFMAFEEAWGLERGAHVPLRVRLHIQPETSPLHALRWETLRDPAMPELAVSCTEQLWFCRYLESRDPTAYQVRAPMALRALVVVANPRDLAAYTLSPIDVVAWQQAAHDALAGWEVMLLPQATWSKLRTALREGYDVLYLVCHGGFVEGQPLLWLEQEDGTSHVVEGREIITAMQELARRPLLTILLACHTGGRDDAAQASVTLGPQLVRVGLPAVIAMHGPMGMTTAAALTTPLLETLRNEGQIDTSLAVARQQVRDQADWWRPVLWLRLRDGRLWAPAAQRLQDGSGRVHTITMTDSAADVVVSGDVHGPIMIDRSQTIQVLPLAPVFLPPLAEALALLATMPRDSVPDPGSLPQPHRMPYARNDLFVGREADLGALAADLAAQRTVVVTTGIGGVGKTQLAIELAYRYGRYFAGGVFWVSCADAATIPTEIAACGGVGGMRLYQEQSGLSLDEQVAMVRAAWAQEYPRLLIFDNCEDEALLVQYRPRGGGCRVLVTSRRQQWAVSLGVRTHPLDILLRGESVQLLLRFAPKLSTAEADAIAAALGDLPLALQLAGSFLMQYGAVVSVAQYLAELAKPTLLDHWSLQGERAGKRWTGPALTDRELHVVRAFALSLDRLDQNDTTDVLALAALARAACLAPGELFPATLLRVTLPLPEGDAEAVIMAHEALRRLRDLGLLEGNPQEMLRMHRLIGAFVQQAVDDDGALVVVEEALIAKTCEVNKIGNPTAMQPLLSHLQHFVNGRENRTDERIAALFRNLGEHFRQTGSYTEGKSLLEHAIAIYERMLGIEHPETKSAMNSFALILYAQGDYATAQLIFEQVLIAREKVVGKAHPTLAPIMNNLARLLRAQGAYARARQLLEQVLMIRNATLGNDHPDVATTMNDLGNVLRAQGEYATARSLLERALMIRTQILGPEHPEVATTMNNLARLYRAQGAYAEARQLLEQVLTIRENLLGVHHPDIAMSLNNLANVLHFQGDNAAARPLLERALAIRTMVLGANHPYTAQSINNLAKLRKAQGDYREAQLLFEQALTIREAVLGVQHPNVAQSLNDLAELLAIQGQYEEARPLCERGLAIREGMLGTDHPDTAQSLHNLGVLDYYQERYAEAADLLRRALAIYEQTVGPQHPDTVETRESLAGVEQRMQE